MANPNLFQINNILGKTAVGAVTTTVSTLITNASASGDIYKVNSVLISNSSGNDITITMDLYRSSTAYYIAYQVTVPSRATLLLSGREQSFYLEEGDALRFTGSVDTNITAVASYEILGNA